MMNKALLFILISLLFIACKKVEKAYYENGKIQQVINFKNDVKDGPSTWYYENGSKESEFNYSNGVLEGVSQRWNLDGKLLFEDNYKGVLKNGISKVFDENGKLVSISTYQNDKLHGKFEEYYVENNAIKVQGNYKYGNFDSIWNYFDPYGRQIGEGTFSGGKGKISTFYSDGKVKQVQNYSANQKSGVLLEYDTEGKLIK